MKMMKSKIFWIIALIVAVMLFKDKPWMKGIIDPIKNMFTKKAVSQPTVAPADQVTTV